MSARAVWSVVLAAGLLGGLLGLSACTREASEGDLPETEAFDPNAVIDPGPALDPNVGAQASASYVFEGDTLLVAVLADLHMAAAQAELSGEGGDSLRQATLALHGLDEAAFADRLALATREPSDVGALYDAVLHRLSLYRQLSL